LGDRKGIREREMTVLQENEATEVDVGQLGRTLGKAMVVGAIVVGVVFAVNPPSEPLGLSPAQMEAARGLRRHGRSPQ
jgi:hypothetical protein